MIFVLIGQMGFSGQGFPTELSSGQPRRLVSGIITADSERHHLPYGGGKARTALTLFNPLLQIFWARNGEEFPFGSEVRLFSWAR